MLIIHLFFTPHIQQVSNKENGLWYYSRCRKTHAHWGFPGISWLLWSWAIEITISLFWNTPRGSHWSFVANVTLAALPINQFFFPPLLLLLLLTLPTSLCFSSPFFPHLDARDTHRGALSECAGRWRPRATSSNNQQCNGVANTAIVNNKLNKFVLFFFAKVRKWNLQSGKWTPNPPISSSSYRLFVKHVANEKVISRDLMFLRNYYTDLIKIW